ncbi:MAG: phosphatidylglycerol lysyltransferase domain-containing protein [Candidatus Lokiarchaeota archaeon]
MELSNAKPIELSDKPIFTNFLKKNPPEISELNFTNLFIWRNYYDLIFLEYNNHLILFSKTYLKKWDSPITGKDDTLMFFPPIGNAPEDLIIELFQNFNNIEIHRVPNKISEKLQKMEDFKKLNLYFQNDRKNWDYVYSREDLIKLQGNKYRSKRRLLEKFNIKYNFEFHIITEDLLEKCRELQNKWCIINECQKNEDLQEEQKAIDELFDNFLTLGVNGGLILVDDNPAGYTFGEMLNEDTTVIHIEKAHTYYEGSYQAINNKFLRHCCHDTAKYVNREQDLGIEGLRKAKNSYHPMKLIEKQKIYQKN